MTRRPNDLLVYVLESGKQNRHSVKIEYHNGTSDSKHIGRALMRYLNLAMSRKTSRFRENLDGCN